MIKLIKNTRVKNKRVQSHYSFDEETLRRWKKVSTEAKLNWLAEAREFFGKKK